MARKAYPDGRTTRVKIDLARPTHTKVRALANLFSYQEGREVTFSETVDRLYAAWEAVQREGVQAKEAGR